jgi:hypothetical protein
MGKSKRSDKEFTKEQRLSKENRELKRELGHLRKQITRLDGDRFETLRQMIVDQEETQRFQENIPSSNMKELKREWACQKENCNGFLEIVLYSKLSQTYYYRACNACSHRTPGKRYDTEVKGIIKK